MKIYIPNYSQDILNKVKDCLLAIFFRKTDLINFLKDSGFYTADFSGIDESLTKATIVDTFFNNIKKNKRITELHNLIRKIIEWRDFDSYWFENGTLDSKIATKKIESLKQIIGEKTTIQEEKEKIKQKHDQEEILKLKKQSKDELKNKFYDLIKIENRQKRGYQFEKFLVDLFKYFEVEVYKAFKLEAEQIDGSIKIDGDNYIIEAKWQEKEIANDSLYQFAYKIETNVLYPRGIFISVNGFSEEAIKMIMKGKSPNLILIDGGDLVAIVEERLGLKEILIEKIRYAQTRSRIFISASEIINEKLI